MMPINADHIDTNEDALLDYLYEEGDAAVRLNVARHLQECARCSVAVLELQSVRGLLGEWTPPMATLGLKMVPADDNAPRERSRGWRQMGAGLPTWAQAAAGVLLFLAGVGVSQLHVEYAPGTLTVRTGSLAAVQPVEPVHLGRDVNLPPASPTLVSMEQSSPSGPSTPSAQSAPAADEVLQRVKALIDQSESRQKHELALRLQDVMHDFDAQRRADMQRVDQNFGQLEGQTGVEVAQQRALLNSLVKVSQGGSK